MSDILYHATKAAYKEGYESANGGLTEARNELIDMTEQRDGLREGIDYASDQLTKVTEQRDRLQLIVDEGCRVSSLCREYREQRDRLAEALQKLADCDWVITLPDRMDAVREIANEALQCLNKPTKTKTK
jgi:uncharacterized coiled-coil DUF342 family protein